MKTTSLFIEYLLAGVLVMVALVILAASVFPIQIKEILDYFEQYRSLPVSVLLATLFVSIAYGIGILTEFLGFWLFEGFHDNIKKKRMAEYLKDLKEDNVDLARSPILKKLEGVPPDEITKKQARSCIGPMRFYVMKENPNLYHDIEYQLHRLRLIRILFIAEVIIMVAVAWQLKQNASKPLLSVLVFFIVTVTITFMAIKHYFNRYCRSVERSYKALVFDQETDITKVEPQIDLERKTRIKKVNTEH